MRMRGRLSIVAQLLFHDALPILSSSCAVLLRIKEEQHDKIPHDGSRLHTTFRRALLTWTCYIAFYDIQGSRPSHRKST